MMTWEEDVGDMALFPRRLAMSFILASNRMSQISFAVGIDGNHKLFEPSQSRAIPVTAAATTKGFSS
jgi:hypothetical protein